MLDFDTLRRAELYFRTYLHTVMPLHTSLIASMCASPNIPLELATTLEDIGQRYMDMAADLNDTLIRRGHLDDEPEPEDYGEARIDAFVDRLVDSAGSINFADGQTVDGRAAVGALPLVRDTVRVAVLIARHAAPGAPPPSEQITARDRER